MTVLSHNPRTGKAGGGAPESAAEGVMECIASAAQAFPDVASSPPSQRRMWLDAIAEALEAEADHLVHIADEETALGETRLRGELAKCAESARFYGMVGAAGNWINAVIDRVPGPTPLELRRGNLPLGPVGVFAASNFPFGFGVLGHDTCSAIAAGCTVVVKAHPAQPQLSSALADVARRTLDAAGAPSGIFSLVSGFHAGLSLVDADAIQAIAFTGSQQAGMALVERAAMREQRIPVFAEMGTVNPAVVTTTAAERRDEIAQGFVDSFTLGQGQFCTKPGLLLAPADRGFVEAVGAAVEAATAGWLLTERIAGAYRRGVVALISAGGVEVGSAPPPDAGYAARPAALSVDIDALQPGSPLLEECFGPVALVAEYRDLDEALAVLRRLQPSLAGAVLTGGADDPDAPAVVSAMARQVGRVVVDGWPTGVATRWGMHHGGPWPATSRADATSVGAEALLRFTRPVSFQGVPEQALPPQLRDDNPWDIPVLQRD